MKPGILSTEFWISLIGQLVSILVLTGVLAPGDATDINAFVAKAAVQIAALIGSIALAWKWIHDRTKLKAAHAEAQATIMAAQAAGPQVDVSTGS